ncbi:MAG: hypothetical protein ACD_8C00013G0009 [uncultured bacterium]|nr:MAG: hypothetical protein ACD_8C00013G0009 [uncultured bacterium]
MKYSYNWLKELSGTKKTAHEIADLITMHSFEVESVEKVGSDFEGVVVGEILEISQHPNADKLQLTKVDAGTGETLGIVCGAHNISVGDLVPVALVGTKLPNGIEIKEAEIRGEKSFGMLCAEDELGLGKSHEGILLLDKKNKIGKPLAEVFGNDDFVLDIKVLPDRAHDAVSHVAMAREIVALEGGEMDYDYDGLILPNRKSKNLKIKIEDSSQCARYIGAVMSNVEVGPSPEWMKNTLEACGINAINNVVDATNYVMLELGQPLHAFDADVIGNEIIVRSAKEGEEIVLLDGSEKKLQKNDIVIANKREALALAGIMGGQKSGISDQTSTIILEAANFKALSIRKTRSRLALMTDASSRFEKELDPNLSEKAMVRLIEILEHTAGAVLQEISDEYHEKIKPWKLTLEIAYINRLLGINVPVKESKKILESLGLKVDVKKEIIVVEVPTFRIDLKSSEDLIEEIGRLYGYEKIADQAPHVLVMAAKQNESRIFERALKNILLGQGFSEVYNYSFYGPKEVSSCQLGAVKHLELEMPMSPDQSLLRISLIPNILKNVRENLKNFGEFHIFEIGKTYWPTLEALPEEKVMLVGAMVLEKKNVKKMNSDKRAQSGFFEAKASVDHVLAQLGITDHYYNNLGHVPVETPASLWHQSRSAEIKIQGSEQSLGFVGEINPFVLESFDINTRVVMFEFEMEKLLEISEAEREYTPIRKHPIVSRDLSMIADSSVSVDEILAVIQLAGGDLVIDVDLFDVIDFADDQSSIAFHITLGASEKTLNGKEVDDVMNLIMTNLENKLKVKIRK